jgi:hypothetical protein
MTRVSHNSFCNGFGVVKIMLRNIKILKDIKKPNFSPMAKNTSRYIYFIGKTPNEPVIDSSLFI